MLTHSGRHPAVIMPDDIKKATEHLVVLDCRNLYDYYSCHLDGALHVDLESDLTSALDQGADPIRGGRHPLPTIESWQSRLRAWGIQPDSLVVVYDDADAAEGAARAWWMLTASGVRASVIDGGWQAALKAELATNEDTPQPKSSSFEFTQWLLPTVDMETVDRLRKDPTWALLDVRAPQRWRGECEHIDPIAGRIPGSKNLFYRENYKDGYFKKPQELQKIYLELLDGVPPSRTVALCGSGVTSCQTLLALHHAGLYGARLYVGSFSEWCRNKHGEDIQVSV